MFCKHCGKEIAEDSMFCKYCGTKLRETIEKETREEMPSDSSKIKVEVYDGHKPEKEEKSKNNKSSFANEIVALFKIILLSGVIWVLYGVGFEIYYFNDTKPHPNLAWGGSRYDEDVIVGNYVLNEDDANLEFDNALYYEKQNIDRFGKQPMASYLKDMSAEEIKKWKEERIKEDRLRFSEDINSNRKYSHEENRKEQLKYSAIIILLTLVLGRYLWKSIKWVNNNKS